MASLIETLLALNRGDLPPIPAPAQPVPLAPVPNLGPLSNDTALAFGAQNPEPVPPALALAPAPDMNFVNQYSGPAPTAPVIRQPGFLDKLSTALLGVSAGLQGRGPQFIDSVREERQRPVREYQRQLDQFNERRTRGLEIAERRSEREQDRAQRADELRYEREFQAWVKKTGVRDAEAKERMRQAFEIQKLREKERADDERAAAQEQKQLRLKAADLAKSYRLAGANQYAIELAERDTGLRDRVSPAADKWLSNHVKLEQARLNKIAAGGAGGGGTERTIVELVGPDGVTPLGRMRYNELKFDSNTGAPSGFPAGTQVRFPQAAQPTPAPTIDTRMPEFDLTRMFNPPAPSGKTITMDKVRQNAKKADISVTTAVQQFRDAGYTIQK